MIVVFSGPPCSGKSYIGERLAARRGLIHLEMDAIRVRLLPQAAHTRADRVVAYRAMHYAAEMLARSGRSVIVNAVYGHRRDRMEIYECAGRAHAQLYLVQFKVSLPVALERARLRRQRHPGLDLDDARVTHLIESFRYFDGSLVVDSEDPADTILEQVEHYLVSSPPVDADAWIAKGED